MSFNFKQFDISDDLCTMKVGTDAVLLGAWANIADVGTILDIGTGSGVIALMLAQRSTALIDAVEIDNVSSQQAKENVNRSKWVGRVLINAVSLQHFVECSNKTYDLIVSNPPYFVDSLKSDNPLRNIARHNDSLPFEELARCVVTLLNKNGHFCMILPEPESNVFGVIALKKGLFCVKKTFVLPKNNRSNVRVLTEYSFNKQTIVSDYIVLRNEDNTYTKQYIEFTKDFYLNL